MIAPWHEQRRRRTSSTRSPSRSAGRSCYCCRRGTELAQELGMAEPGASKHLRVLREVGLVRDRKAGKQRLYGLDARGLRPVHEWTGGFERFWNESFDRLDEYVQDLEQARQED